MTKEEHLKKLEEFLSKGQGKAIFVNRGAKIVFSPKNYKSYKEAGMPLFKLDPNGLFIARGSKYEYAPFGTFVIQLIPF